MFEFIKHSLGLCGEGHIHLLNLSPFLIGIAGYFTYIKLKLKSMLWKNN